MIEKLGFTREPRPNRVLTSFAHRFDDTDVIKAMQALEKGGEEKRAKFATARLETRLVYTLLYRLLHSLGRVTPGRTGRSEFFFLAPRDVLELPKPEVLRIDSNSGSDIKYVCGELFEGRFCPYPIKADVYEHLQLLQNLLLSIAQSYGVTPEVDVAGNPGIAYSVELTLPGDEVILTTKTHPVISPELLTGLRFIPTKMEDNTRNLSMVGYLRLLAAPDKK